MAFDSSFLKGEVGGSKQQQRATSRASPAGRYQTSWIFCSAGNWTDELVPDIWANELMSLLREQYPRETTKIVI